MIKLLKSGNWAVEGVHVVEMVEGVEQSFGAAEDFKLVAAGWAEWVKVIHLEEQEQEQEQEQESAAETAAEVTPEIVPGPEAPRKAKK